MKLTKQQLKQIIKEELEKVLNEEAFKTRPHVVTPRGFAKPTPTPVRPQPVQPVALQRQSIIDIEVKYHEEYNQVYANLKTEPGPDKFQATLSHDGNEVEIFFGDTEATDLFTPEDEEKVKSALHAAAKR